MHTLVFHESNFERPACVIALIEVRYSLEVAALLRSEHLAIGWLN